MGKFEMKFVIDIMSVEVIDCQVIGGISRTWWNNVLSNKALQF